jgi:hypothetical protein
MPSSNLKEIIEHCYQVSDCSSFLKKVSDCSIASTAKDVLGIGKQEKYEPT